MKKMLAVLLVFILTLALCACNKDNSNPNVPDNVVTPNEDVTTSNNKEDSPDAFSSEVTSVSEPEEEVTSDTSASSDAPTTSETDGEEVVADDEPDEPEIDVSEIIDIHEYKAFEHLYLLNSGKVHAKFTEIVSYDGEYIIGTDREFFVDGTDSVYINGSEKIIINIADVYVCNTEAMTYYTYANDHSLDGFDRFGYGILNYSNVSVSDSDDKTIEVFEIADGDSIITSTWTFYDNGSFTVYDTSSGSDGYFYYTFEFANEDISEMDMNIPDGCEETDSNEYEGF